MTGDDLIARLQALTPKQRKQQVVVMGIDMDEQVLDVANCVELTTVGLEGQPGQKGGKPCICIRY